MGELIKFNGAKVQKGYFRWLNAFEKILTHFPRRFFSPSGSDGCNHVVFKRENDLLIVRK